MLMELKQAVAIRASVCNDKISVITAIVGSSTQTEQIQKVGTALQKLDVRKISNFLFKPLFRAPIATDRDIPTLFEF